MLTGTRKDALVIFFFQKGTGTTDTNFFGVNNAGVDTINLNKKL